MGEERRRQADLDLVQRVLTLEQGQHTILSKLEDQRHKIAENTALTEKVESNTAPLVKLARQVEGTFDLLAKLSGVLRIILKTFVYVGLFLGAIAAGGYALFHGGHLPEWFRALLYFYKEIE